MIAGPAVFRRILQLLAIAAIVTFAQSAFTQCAAPKEEGRWRNLDNNGEPSFIDIRMTGGCGDEVLNGVQTGGQSRYSLRVWVRQSSGQYFGRPTVKAAYRRWKNQQWLQGNVYTGGYQDQMWVRAEERDGRSQLHVFIIHKSLDSKPSSQSEYWFAWDKKI